MLYFEAKGLIAFSDEYLNMKRGIAPLIATVILIGLTVALAALFLTWGTRFAKETTSETSKTAEETLLYLEGVNIKVKQASQTESIISIENKGDINIVGVIVRGFYENGVGIANSERIVDCLPLDSGCVWIEGDGDFVNLAPFEIKKLKMYLNPRPSDQGDWCGSDGIVCVNNVEVIPFVENSEGKIVPVMFKKTSLNVCAGVLCSN